MIVFVLLISFHFHVYAFSLLLSNYTWHDQSQLPIPIYYGKDRSQMMMLLPTLIAEVPIYTALCATKIHLISCRWL